MVTNNMMQLSWGSNRNYPQYQTLREHRYWFRTISEKSWFSGRIQKDFNIVSASILKPLWIRAKLWWFFWTSSESEWNSGLESWKSESESAFFYGHDLESESEKLEKKCNLNHTLNKYWKRSEFRSDSLLNLPQCLVWAYIRWEKKIH